MSYFEQLGDKRAPLLGGWLLPLGALLTSALIAFLATGLPGLFPWTIAKLWICVVGFVSLIFIVTTWLTLFLHKHRMNSREVALRFASLGIWFLPVWIAVMEKHVWSIALAGGVAIVVAGILRWYKHAVIEEGGTIPELDFQPGKPLALITASAAQAGIIALVLKRVSLAALLLAFSCFLIAWWTMAMTELPRWTLGSLSKSKPVVSVLFATLLTGILLLPILNPTRYRMLKGESGTSRALSAKNLHSGVILLADIPPHLKVTIPQPASRNSFLQRRVAVPDSIPFTGEYWFSYFFGRPSKNSLVEKGSPIQFKFTAFGPRHLWMQARQRLEKPINTTCCRRIDVSISNADPFPHTVSVEFILLGHTEQKITRQSLGEIEVSSAPAKSPRTNASPVNETLAFAMPSTSAVREFDEIAILFHLQAPRRQRSANIAVNSFSLVPAGI